MFAHCRWHWASSWLRVLFVTFCFLNLWCLLFRTFNMQNLSSIRQPWFNRPIIIRFILPSIIILRINVFTINSFFIFWLRNEFVFVISDVRTSESLMFCLGHFDLTFNLTCSFFWVHSLVSIHCHLFVNVDVFWIRWANSKNGTWWSIYLLDILAIVLDTVLQCSVFQLLFVFTRCFRIWTILVNVKIVIWVVWGMDNLHWWVFIWKTNRILMPIVISVVEVLQIILGIGWLSWNIVAFVMRSLFLLVFRCLLVTRSDAIHKVRITLMLSYLRLLLRIKVQIFRCFSHILWSFYSRNNSLMPSSLNCAFSLRSCVRRNSKLTISNAWCASDTCNGSYLLWTNHLIFKTCWVHAHKRWSSRLVTSINPVIIFNLYIFQYLSGSFIRFIVFLSRLQCSLLFNLIIFILVTKPRLCILMESKTAADRVINATSDRLILMRVWFIFAVTHISFRLLVVIQSVILISWICNRSSHVWNTAHVERALRLLMRRNWWFVDSGNMRYPWNRIISLWMDINVSVIVINNYYLSTISKLLSLHLLLSCENVIKSGKSLILVRHWPFPLVRLRILFDSWILASKNKWILLRKNSSMIVLVYLPHVISLLRLLWNVIKRAHLSLWLNIGALSC